MLPEDLKRDIQRIKNLKVIDGVPKADFVLKCEPEDYWISYKHGDYIDKTGKELPASFQQYGSLKSFFTKQFTNKAQDEGIEKLINSFLFIFFSRSKNYTWKI